MAIVPPATVIAAARAWVGTPYHHQASALGVGCDCLGLGRGVWRQVIGPEPMSPPPYSRDWGEVGHREVMLDALSLIMPRTEPGPGALLVFRMARSAIAKHGGIMTRDGTFVHARETTGVIEEPLTEPWRRRIAAAFAYAAEGAV